MKKLLVACIALVTLMANSAFAETYYYTGPNFTVFQGVGYTPAMSVMGSITTSSPIPPNSVDLDITGILTSWTFSDGVQTISSSNGGSLDPWPPLPFPPIFSTDALGDITSGNIIVHTDPWAANIGEIDNIIFVVDGLGLVSLGANNAVCMTVDNGSCSEYSSINAGQAEGVAGTWSTTPPPAAPVPTMSVWGLGILAGLLGLIGFVRRRKL